MCVAANESIRSDRRSLRATDSTRLPCQPSDPRSIVTSESLAKRTLFESIECAGVTVRTRVVLNHMIRCLAAVSSVLGVFGCARPGYTDCNKLKGVSMIGAGGLVVSVIAFAVGAILDWAVTEPYQHGFNINKVGLILMLVGAVGAVLSIIVMAAGNTRRRQTVVDDGRGNVVRRVDSTY